MSFLISCQKPQLAPGLNNSTISLKVKPIHNSDSLFIQLTIPVS